MFVNKNMYVCLYVYFSSIHLDWVNSSTWLINILCSERFLKYYICTKPFLITDTLHTGTICWILTWLNHRSTSPWWSAGGDFPEICVRFSGLNLMVIKSLKSNTTISLIKECSWSAKSEINYYKPPFLFTQQKLTFIWDLSVGHIIA